MWCSYPPECCSRNILKSCGTHYDKVSSCWVLGKITKIEWHLKLHSAFYCSVPIIVSVAYCSFCRCAVRGIYILSIHPADHPVRTSVKRKMENVQNWQKYSQWHVVGAFSTSLSRIYVCHRESTFWCCTTDWIWLSLLSLLQIKKIIILCAMALYAIMSGIFGKVMKLSILSAYKKENHKPFKCHGHGMKSVHCIE